MSKFTEWYAANAEKLNEKRRLRYKVDTAYRQEILDRNYIYKQNLKDSEPGTLYTIEINGIKASTRLYTIGFLAELAKCSVQAIRVWEKEGIIFETPFRDPVRNNRLYTMEMVELLYKILLYKGKLDFSHRKDKTQSIIYLCEKLDKNVLCEITFYKRGYLAESCGKSARFMRDLESFGYLPKSPYFTAKGISLYTEEMVKDVRQVLEFHEGQITPERGAKVYRNLVYRWSRLQDYRLILANKELNLDED